MRFHRYSDMLSAAGRAGRRTPDSCTLPTRNEHPRRVESRRENNAAAAANEDTAASSSIFVRGVEN